MIREVSPDGARLGIGSRHDLPDRFDLIVKNTGRAMRVRLARHEGNYADVLIEAVVLRRSAA
jgi:hypothetical protein